MKESITSAALSDDANDSIVAIEFQPLAATATAVELLMANFPGEEVLESHAFTGTELLILIIAATRETLGKALNFYIRYRETFKGATIKIGKDEISLENYSMEDAQKFFELEAVQKLLKERNRK